MIRTSSSIWKIIGVLGFILIPLGAILCAIDIVLIFGKTLESVLIIIPTIIIMAIAWFGLLIDLQAEEFDYWKYELIKKPIFWVGVVWFIYYLALFIATFQI